MKKVIKYIIGAMMVPVLFSSCLKDKEKIGPDADGAVENIIEFKNMSAPASDKSSTYPLFNRMYDIKPKDELMIPLQIAGVYNPSGDVKIVLELDNSILEKYNEENETGYVPLKSSYYQIPSLEVTIPQGERIANLVVNVFPEKFDYDEAYALGFRIKSVSSGTISGNFGAILVGIGAKNKVDGVYTVTGSAADLGSKNIGQYPKRAIALETYGPNSVLYHDDYYGIYGTIFLTETGGATYYGNFCPIFDFDPTTGKITGVRNAYGSNNSQSRDAKLDPAGVNKITFGPDGRAAKIEVSYFMTQAGNVRLTYNEVFTYSTAR